MPARFAWPAATLAAVGANAQAIEKAEDRLKFREAMEKIGDGLPSDAVFQSRVPLKPDDPLPPTEDLVMSRILWLDGLDEHNANTHDRFIYIHGTKHEDKIGNPASLAHAIMYVRGLAETSPTLLSRASQAAPNATSATGLRYQGSGSPGGGCP